VADNFRRSSGAAGPFRKTSVTSVPASGWFRWSTLLHHSGGAISSVTLRRPWGPFRRPTRPPTTARGVRPLGSAV